jgi:deoxyribodipyrimidine photo-lyase
VRGDPAEAVPRLAAAVDARAVHAAADFGPYGRCRDDAVAAALAADGRELVRTGSPYAVAPGRVTTAEGRPFRVFGPYRRAWERHGWRAPADTGAHTLSWLDPQEKRGGPRRVRIPADETSTPRCRRRGRRPPGRGGRSSSTAAPPPTTTRRSGTARTGPAPRGCRCTSSTARCTRARTLLTDLAGRRGVGAEAVRSELAWREFYADVLFARPDSARENFDRRFDVLRTDSGPAADERFAAWTEGRTGFPIVDAGLRQLREVAWMHNRVRMIVASFLVKDLHLPWQRGARHFMRLLADGDLPSNQHGWQWIAGSGTDPAPYVRVFNPISQGEKFDPDGEYVRRFVPELRGVPGGAVHRPWDLPGGIPAGYPAPIIDHARERREALARYEQVQAARG